MTENFRSAINSFARLKKRWLDMRHDILRSEAIKIVIANKRRFLSLGKIAITLGLLAFLSSKIDSRLLWQSLQGFSLVCGLAMVCLHSATLLLMALRWRLIAAKLGIDVDYGHFVAAVWLGAAGSQIGPALITAELLRFKALHKQADSGALITSQVLDRLSGQIALFTLLILTLPFNWPLFSTLVSDKVLTVIGLILALISLLFFKNNLPKFTQFLYVQHIAQILHLRERHYWVSMTIHLALMCCFVLADIGMGQTHEVGQIFILLPLVFAGLSLLPISVSDWGTRELLSVYVLSYAGISPETSTAISLVFGFSYTLTAILGAVILAPLSIARKDA